MIGHLAPGSMLMADKGYDANALRALVGERGAWANIPPKSNRKDPICFSRHLYRDRNLIERFFNKIKQFRRVATRYDKLAENFLASLKLVCVRIWLRGNESTAYEIRFHRGSLFDLAGGMVLRKAGCLSIRVKWLTDPLTKPVLTDDELVGAKVYASFKASDRTYGGRRVWRDMLAEGGVDPFRRTGQRLGLCTQPDELARRTELHA